MKRDLFVILVSILFVLVLIYFYDKKEEIVNRKYQDEENNILIQYPYFNRSAIDNYVNLYLESFIEQKNNLVDSLFIDYDYEEIGDRIELFLYIYQEKGNMVQKEIRKMEFDLDKGDILKTQSIMDVSVEFDIYEQKLVDRDQMMVALTFDDGPNYNTSRILDILEKYGIKGTFFILGTNISGNEEIISRMNELGMELGNHMYSHKLLTRLSSGQIKEEIQKVDQLIFDIVGKYPSLVRPCYGTVNKKIKSSIDRPIITWNVDTLDWKYHNSKRIASRVMNDVGDGDIILMHDIYRATANSLEIIIPKLLEKGYQFVTVSELLYYKNVDVVSGKVIRHAR